MMRKFTKEEKKQLKKMFPKIPMKVRFKRWLQKILNF